jgi:hypothetical protein
VTSDVFALWSAVAFDPLTMFQIQFGRCERAVVGAKGKRIKKENRVGHRVRKHK